MAGKERRVNGAPDTNSQSVAAGGRFWLPNGLIDRYAAQLDPSALAVYVYLARWARGPSGSCYHSLRSIAMKLGVSRSTVKRAVRKLAALDLITVHRRTDRFGGPDTNLYTIKPLWGGVAGDPTTGHPRTEEGSPMDRGSGHPRTEGGVMGEPGVGSPMTPKGQSSEGRALEGQALEGRAPQGPATEEQASRFAAFWDLFPKKHNRAAAARAWEALNPSVELQGQILQAVEAQKNWPAWSRENDRFIPSPANWLRDRRWEDHQPESERGNHANQRTKARFDERRHRRLPAG
jgi:hypothetical protein